MHICDTAFATVRLARYPETRNPTLQPFDAADLYLLRQAREAGVAGPVLVVNDQFGALAVALAMEGHAVDSWGDSHLAERALQANLAANGLQPNAVRFVSSQQAVPQSYKQALLRIPKSLSLLADQLGQLAEHLQPAGKLFAGAMIKHLPHSAGDLIEAHIGDYQASLGWKKARLLLAQRDPARRGPDAPEPTRYPLEGTALELENLPGVFSRERLDIGTRALLPHIESGLGGACIVDLGCGNGALGLQAALLNPEARLVFIDESYAAVATAQRNFTQAFPGREARFLVADGLRDGLDSPADLILCNPPFHQQQVVGDEIATGMFQQAQAALAPGGRLLVVGNRHLGYHLSLKRLFGGVRQRGATPKFVILEAERR